MSDDEGNLDSYAYDEIYGKKTERRLQKFKKIELIRLLQVAMRERSEFKQGLEKVCLD